MSPNAIAWLNIHLQALFWRVFPRRLWERFLHKLHPLPASVPELKRADWAPLWDIAAETGEFTHIIKDGSRVLSIVQAAPLT